YTLRSCRAGISALEGGKPLQLLRYCLRFESGAAEVYNSLVSSFPPGGNMPHYEFYCHACKKLFSKILSLVDYEKTRSCARIAGAKTSSSAGLPLPSSRRKRARERAGTCTYALRQVFLRFHPDRWRHPRQLFSCKWAH